MSAIVPYAPALAYRTARTMGRYLGPYIMRYGARKARKIARRFISHRAQRRKQNVWKHRNRPRFPRNPYKKSVSRAIRASVETGQLMSESEIHIGPYSYPLAYGTGVTHEDPYTVIRLGEGIERRNVTSSTKTVVDNNGQNQVVIDELHDHTNDKTKRIGNKVNYKGFQYQIYLSNEASSEVQWVRMLVVELRKTWQYRDHNHADQLRVQNDKHPGRNMFKADLINGPGLDYANNKFNDQTNIQRVWHPLNLRKYKVLLDKKTKLSPTNTMRQTTDAFGSDLAGIAGTNPTGSDHKCLSGYFKLDRFMTWPAAAAPTDQAANPKAPMQDIRVILICGNHVNTTMNQLTPAQRKKVRVNCKVWEYFNA